MKSLRHDVGQHGAVAVLVALILVVLIGAAGIVLDLGRLFVAKTELQNAADACALAAARELMTTRANRLIQAENAGITVGNMHRFDFQDSQVQFVKNQDVTFSTRLAPFDNLMAGGSPANVRYVRCTREVPGFIPWFMRLLGAGSYVVGATAVAEARPGGPACKIPIGLCKDINPTKGQWYGGRFDSSDGINGNFNWIDFDGGGGGANELGVALAGCLDVPTPDLHDMIPGERGSVESAAMAWNSRFGVYKKGQGQNQPSPETGAISDTTGYGYTTQTYSQAHDAFPDYTSKQAQFVPYQDTVPGYETTQDLTGGEAMRRVVTLPLVNCSTWDSSGKVEFLGWACALMLAPMDPTSQDKRVQLEYLGMAGEEGVPCSAFGGPGGPGPLVPTLVQ